MESVDWLDLTPLLPNRCCLQYFLFSRIGLSYVHFDLEKQKFSVIYSLLKFHFSSVYFFQSYFQPRFFVHKFPVNFNFSCCYISIKCDFSVFKNFRFSNLRTYIFRTSVKFNFEKFDRVGLRKNIADNVFGLGDGGQIEAETFN